MTVQRIIKKQKRTARKRDLVQYGMIINNFSVHTTKGGKNAVSGDCDSNRYF